MKENTYDKATYEQDFPAIGDWNWKRVRFNIPEDVYYHGHEIIGVVLHDGNFMINGVLFLADQFEIVDEDPHGLVELARLKAEDEKKAKEK